ncbi:hypothetical protein AAIE21_22190 [Paenibacillus sp. 102]|uniref:hypothetical protein n=1 Tax=Paenibacillus sp. 102 TaxID=3120823 RepID=UPI0031BAE822
MFFSTEQIKELDLTLLDEYDEVITKNSTRDVNISYVGFGWIGFRTPDNKKVYYMGQNLKQSENLLVFSFYNSEKTDVKVKIIRYVI